MNQNPEQKARDIIDRQLLACGWLIQEKSKINLGAGKGIAIKEYLTDAGPADYVLFVEKKPVGIIEAKREEEGIHLTVVEDQSTEYASSKLKYLNNHPLPFVYESTGEITRFTDYRDPKPRSQIMDTINPDKLTNVGWDKQNTEKAETMIHDFKTWIETHKDEITALQIFYDQPYRRRELTFKMIKDVFELLKTDKPLLAPLNIWRAYEQLGASTSSATQSSPKNELVALVSLIRLVSGIEKSLTVFDKTVDKNFQDWVFKKQAGTLKFTEDQMNWLRMIKDYMANSFHIAKDDFDLSPFNASGGLTKMWTLFGEQTDEIIEELNEVLAA